MSQANMTQQSSRRKRSHIEREMVMLSLTALAMLLPGLIAVFIIPPLGVLLMIVGSIVWIWKDKRYVSELQTHGYPLTDK